MQFKDILGQKKIKQRLIKTVKENRLSHAQLFLGQEGSAKLPLAIAYAQYICCTNKQENDSCGECLSCKKMQHLTHPDLHFMYPVVKKASEKTTISKDYIKEWREFLLENDYFVSLHQWHNKINAEKKNSLISTADCNEMIHTFSSKSYESEYKIMIIWMAERLYHQAAPKILKILEEPYEKTLFVLIVEDQDKLLKTILSRTQLVKFLAYEDEEVESYLIQKQAIESHKARAISLIAEGNIVKARKLATENVDNSANYSIFRNWMLICYQAKILALPEMIDQIVAMSREQLKELFLYGIQAIRNSLMINNQNQDLVRAIEEEKQFVFNFAKMINQKNAAKFIHCFNEAILHIERNANAKIMLSDISFQCMRFFKVK